ncbi:MAG: alpha/beta family hydrolase, partial [Bacteroidota bacterium]
MKKDRSTLSVSDSIGTVTIEIFEPETMKAMLVLGHGAGAGMDHRFMVDLSLALAEQQIGTMRYNFPYIEQKKKMPSPPAIAEKTVAMAIKKAHELFPSTPLLAGGKSFGGRMTSQYTSKDCPAFLKGIVLFGFPLHAPGKPSQERGSHLSHISIPMLFLQGTKDDLAKIDLMENVTATLQSAHLIKLEGAN